MAAGFYFRPSFDAGVFFESQNRLSSSDLMHNDFCYTKAILSRSPTSIYECKILCAMFFRCLHKIYYLTWAFDDRFWVSESYFKVVPRQLSVLILFQHVEFLNSVGPVFVAFEL